MNSPDDNGKWAMVTVGVVCFVGVWFLAVLVFSKGGPAGVTAFGLLVMFGLMLMFLSWEAQDGRDMDRERIARNRKRRAWRLRRKPKPNQGRRPR